MKTIHTLSYVTIATIILVGCGSSSDGSASTATKDFLNNTNLPDLHILPVLTDEDGNNNDDKATYTLTANQNVNVDIQTPTGNWATPM